MNLEELTFDQLARVKKSYDVAADDAAKIYQLSTMISLLTALREFFDAKESLRRQTST